MSMSERGLLGFVVSTSFMFSMSDTHMHVYMYLMLLEYMHHDFRINIYMLH
jgi:hypothetical protein